MDGSADGGGDQSAMSEPTPRQLAAWEAYVASGSMKAAADRLQIHEITVRKRIAELRDVYGVRTNVQLAIAIEREKAA
jgi:DNA-binding NarL/FixJ family response regulator